MKLLQRFTGSVLEEVKVGTLVVIELDNCPVLAIKLMGNGEEVLLAVLEEHGDDNGPHLITIRDVVECLSYGAEWVFEIPEPASLDCGETGFNQPGVVAFGRAGTGLRLGRDRSRRGGSPSGSFLLVESLKTTTELQGATFGTSEWAIWVSDEHRSELGSKPLLRHSGP
ncbi:hypothetical protein [Pararhizobium mangrovi]|uniref:Uncharacterized protein n=1 Tax=Pararhizobium mangrovi TaxID=2590452 RepID=A0A506TZ65_9HYPH|nr:hypothetical protein [Pararhizobium mangrovi]TPW26024.1 hypothetical protein FJU11_16555 [Pararhizobium mangrovi]